jgi:hypothetical protein
MSLALLGEVQALVSKNAIRVIVPPFREGFWSTFFLVPKPNGDWRPILNLKPLNVFIKPEKFRMDTLKMFLGVASLDSWAATIDLKDAYLHVPIHEADRRWLRFQLQGSSYEFQCLPFGLSTAPRVFTRIVKAVGAFLRSQGIQVAMYLDDWLITAGSRELCLRHTHQTLHTLQRLGFLVNEAKSNLTPTQTPIYLGAQLDLAEGRVYPTQARVNSLISVVGGLLAQPQPIAEMWLKGLGHMASLVDIVPWCRTHMRLIQLHLNCHFRPVVDRLSKPVPMSPLILRELTWWTHAENLMVGIQFPAREPHFTVTTDAVTVGMGGHMGVDQVNGQWTTLEACSHINLLELWAVRRVLGHFEEKIRGKMLRIQSDNRTVVAYINKEGGVRSPTLCAHALTLLAWCVARGITLVAVHVGGKTNVLADNLSRGISLDPSECTLKRSVARRVIGLAGSTLDLFATRSNAQCQSYCSRYMDREAFAIDALSLDWTGLNAYAFPPISLIPLVLSKIARQRCKVVLIAPHWPRQMWFHKLLELIVAPPRVLPVDDDLLTDMEGIYFPNVRHLHLTAWNLCCDASERTDFLRSQPSLLCGDEELPHDERTLRIWTRLSDGALRGTSVPVLPLLQ